MRDETNKAPNYTAKPLFNLNSSVHTYAATPLWWVVKPYVLASGRSPSAALVGGAGSNYDPATGVYVTAFIRGDDGKLCVVYANFSVGSTTDTIAFTVGGVAHDYSGTRTDFVPLSTGQGSLLELT